MIRRLALVLSFLAVSAVAETLSIDPPDPTSKDPVKLTVQWMASCAQNPDVTRSGFQIVVALHAGLCGFPPSLVTQQVDLGTLPAGQYTASIAFRDPPVSLSFTVFDANDFLSVKPSLGSSAGGTAVNVVVVGTLCENRPVTACGAPAITFGGVPATNVAVVDSSHFRATTPPHAAGAVQVVVTGDSLSKSSYAFRYYDPSGTAPPMLFEKVLIPVILNGPGANGSNWETEVSLRNDNTFTVEPWRPIAGTSAIAPSKPLRFGSENAPGGLFLTVPRESSANLAFEDIVRDTSQGDRDFGTEVPVVRESDFSSNGIDLIGIPIDPRFRLNLRVFGLDDVQLVGVTISSLDDGTTARRFYIPMSSPTADRPAFGAASNFTAGTSAQRIGLRISPWAGRIWAFVTITNNDTQHVTVVSPH